MFRPSRNSRLLLAVGIVCFALCGASAQAGTQLWSAKLNQEVKWHMVTSLGSLLVGTDDAVFCYDAQSGKVLWQRAELKKVDDDQVVELEGTPFIMVGENQGSSKSRLHALDMTTGQDAWVTEKIKGAIVSVTPVYSKDMVLLATVSNNRVNKDRLDLLAVKVFDGTVLWESEMPDKVDLHLSDTSGSFIQRFDLSGHQPPVVDADSFYVTWAGLHRFDLATGKLIWAVPYDVTEGNLKRGNAQAAVDEEMVYTSAKGIVRAHDKKTGTVIWKSQDFGAAVAEMVVHGDRIYCRMGGSFYDWGKKEWVLKKPLGVAAVVRKTGTSAWRYDNAKDSITNMALFPEQNYVLIADAENLIGLDTTAEGKVKEAFRTKLEFKHKIGAGSKALKQGLKFARGGLIGMMKKDKSELDMPVAIVVRNSGTAVVMGKQHVLAFDPKSRAIPWSVEFDAPGVPGWQKIVMAAITYMQYSYYYGRASSTQLGTRENTWANNQKSQAVTDFMNVYFKRYSAAASTGRFTYVLTNVEDGKDETPGLVGVNLEDGSAVRQVVLRDKQPNYKVDEIGGILFNVKDKKEISAYTIQ